MSAPIYTFLAVDLRTGSVLAELPMVNASFERLLNSAGTWQGEIAMGDPRVSRIDVLDNTPPGRTAVYVDRAGVLVYAGIIWTRRRSQGRIALAGSELMSYYGNRLVGTVSYTNTDQLTIAAGLMSAAKAAPGGDIGVTIPSAPVSNVFVSQSYHAYDVRLVGQEIQRLSQAANGFDFSIDPAYTAGGAIGATFVLSYPRRGANFAATGWVFDYPGNISEVTSFSEDAGAMADSITEIGAGSGAGTLVSVQTDAAMLTAGYPLLEASVTDKTIVDPGQLNAAALGQLGAREQPIITAQVCVRGDADPVFGSYTTGDEARFILQGPEFGPGLDTYYRIIGIKVEPNPASYEKVTLTLGPPWAG